MTAGPRFAPGIDPEQLKSRFARHGRLHIPGVFAEPNAQAIGDALAGDMPWHRSVNIKGKAYDLALDQIEAMPPDRRAEFETAVLEGGRTGFQYQFDAWRLSDLMEADMRGAVPALEALYDFLNGEAFLGFARALTGEDACAYVDAQATRYTPGHFLTAHDDDVAGKNRLFAYVLNFTPAWRTDWGGLLLFHDADGNVAEGYSPAFNALNIFRVPQLHSVSPVAAYAGAPRLSVTGWIRSQRPST